MEKIKVDIINNTINDTVHLSIDYGEFTVVKANQLVRTLLRIILHPDKYRVDIIEH